MPVEKTTMCWLLKDLMHNFTLKKQTKSQNKQKKPPAKQQHKKPNPKQNKNLPYSIIHRHNSQLHQFFSFYVITHFPFYLSAQVGSAGVGVWILLMKLSVIFILVMVYRFLSGHINESVYMYF